jgi:hypothetical protein
VREKLQNTENRACPSAERNHSAAEPSEIRTQRPEAGPKTQELESVSSVISSLLTAMKSYALYPESHAMCRNAVENFSRLLESFLEDHPCLRLDVDKEGIFFQNRRVYESPPGTESLPFLLYRDGIQWLEFRRGISSTELLALLMIFKRYRDIREEAEGDLVTALWELDLPNLRYEAADIFWESQQVADLSELNAGQLQEGRTEQPEEVPDITPTPSADPDDFRAWKLNRQESEELLKMVLEEESRDPVEDVLDIVLIVLDDQRAPKDLSQVLRFLEDEFQDTLEQGEFQFAFKFLRGLRGLRKTYEIERSWTIPLIDEFFQRISGDGVLGALDRVLPTLDTPDSEQINGLGQFLVLLPSDAILVLGPLLPKIPFPKIERQIMTAIGVLAKKDLRSLERLLTSQDEVMVERLVYVLGHLRGERPTQTLLKMLDHPADRVRKQALKHLLRRDEKLIETLFQLVEDSSDAIRWMMLTYLGKSRSPLAESLLVDYLDQRKSKINTNEHILACYAALGECGSSRCIPLLRRALLKKHLIPSRQKSLHRRGAAVALNILKTDEAEEILRKASRSFFPGVRLAYRSVHGG